MGVDIHLNLIQPNGELILNEIYDGRNYSWFDALQGVFYEGYEVYKCLNYTYGIPAAVPSEVQTDFDNQVDQCTYGFAYIKLVDFVDWFNDYLPHKKAGWMRKYDAWLAENKHISPTEDDVLHYLDGDHDDYVFCEYTDEYEPSLYIINKLNKAEVLTFRSGNVHPDYEKAILLWYFDR